MYLLKIKKNIEIVMHTTKYNKYFFVYLNILLTWKLLKSSISGISM